jgi:S1-C subfamily serine protease
VAAPAGPTFDPRGPMLGIAIAADAEGRTVVRSVAPDSGAEKAGLQVGDVLVSIDDKPIESFGALMEAVQAHKVGDRVRVALERGGAQQTVEVTLGPRS